MQTLDPKTWKVVEDHPDDAGHGGPRAALRYAARAYAALDRRMDEARALADWLARSARTLGLTEEQAPADERLDEAVRLGVTAEAWRRVGRGLDAAARRAADGAGEAERWADAVAGALALDPLEADILALALRYGLDRCTERLFLALCAARRGGCGCLHLDAGLFALLLGAPAREVQARLASAARLRASGLLGVDDDGDVHVLPRLTALIARGELPGRDLAGQLLGGTAPRALPWESFAHLGHEADMAAAVLRAALDGRETGVNVLLYGPPGTGKTSFAAALAARVGAPLRPVAEADDAGAEPDRRERLAGLRLAQHLLPPGGAVLLFDEAEDLFGEHRAKDGGTGAGSRVFVHRLLERTPVPVIWTANDIGPLGPAVLRRMTICLELALPDPAARTRLWREMGAAEGVPLPEAEAARLARLVPAAPAVARTALRGARLAGGGAETARRIVEGVARAVNGGAPPAPEPDEDAAYDPALVNADCDLDALADRLARPGAPRAVSLLLLGPPGTGKSAWVRHLASRMGLPVAHKRASDLLDCYVGGTERNIARAFADARASGVFLVFDEADGLLLDRVHARHRWEVSQVNEMLTWMEAHPLPFACTTNLPGRLDGASLRRFLVKARFGWLTPAQARLAFRRFYGLPAPATLDGVRTLAPADFALVRRRAELAGATEDADGLVRLLASECEGRAGGRGPVGFARGATGA